MGDLLGLILGIDSKEKTDNELLKEILVAVNKLVKVQEETVSVLKKLERH